MRAALAAWDFGQVSLLVRQHGSLRQEDIVHLTGLSQASLSLVESGKRRLTNLDKIIDFLSGLSVPADLVPRPLREHNHFFQQPVRSDREGLPYGRSTTAPRGPGTRGMSPSTARGAEDPSDAQVLEALPSLSRVIASYDVPDDGPARPLFELEASVHRMTALRLSAQYVDLAQQVPDLLGELSRVRQLARSGERARVAGLLVEAYRATDALAFKFGASDLSARLIELMRWAASETEDPLTASAVAYVRTETFFAARAHAAGLRALENAIDEAPAQSNDQATAARGSLHMRAAVIAARAGDTDAAQTHLVAARELGKGLREGIYRGTAFGPSSVRIHQVSVAVSLGDGHVPRALEAAQGWAPDEREMPAERRSGFYIELALAQLQAQRDDDAFASLNAARRIAPQHTRAHPWVRQATRKLCRRRSVEPALSQFAEWCNVTRSADE
ncbi:transcriptional regulator [Streptomyces meridianus]|uniref:Transcriptional regulator n=1 Tax=Streptomyces meridianus TaxID=2938945 RepID=A0ABT0X1B3_9ACTN|nr:transcriptional regulator [Streptomyces meridianus]MCM2576343.1 transcriptional regulator [Streptomyces meridianus]